MKGVGRRRTQLLDDLRNRRRYWELKEEAEDLINGNDCLAIEHKEEIHIFQKSKDLTISSILNNNNHFLDDRWDNVISTLRQSY